MAKEAAWVKKRRKKEKKQINVIIFLAADILHLVKYHTKLQQKKKLKTVPFKKPTFCKNGLNLMFNL